MNREKTIAALRAADKALGVILLDPRISERLDPKALAQAIGARAEVVAILGALDPSGAACVQTQVSGENLGPRTRAADEDDAARAAPSSATP